MARILFDSCHNEYLRIGRKGLPHFGMVHFPRQMGLHLMFRTLPQDEGIVFANGPKVLLTRLNPEVFGDRIPCYVNNWRAHVARFMQLEAE